MRQKREEREKEAEGGEARRMADGSCISTFESNDARRTCRAPSFHLPRFNNNDRTVIGRRLSLGCVLLPLFPRVFHRANLSGDAAR